MMKKLDINVIAWNGQNGKLLNKINVQYMWLYVCIACDSKDINNVTQTWFVINAVFITWYWNAKLRHLCYKRLFLSEMHYKFHKNIKQHNCFQYA